MTTNLQDAPRVVLIIGNTAIAHSSLSHDRCIQTSIGKRSTTTARWLSCTNEATDGSISSMLLLDFTSLASSKEEVCTSGNSESSDDTDNDACGDASLACS